MHDKSDVNMYRPVHALECIMGGQGNMVGNSKVFVEVQNDQKYSGCEIVSILIMQYRT